MLYYSIAMQSALLAFAAGEVIERRIEILARGDAQATGEAVLMVGEKMAMAGQVWNQAANALAVGMSPDAVTLGVLGAYRAAVDENRRRLNA